MKKIYINENDCGSVGKAFEMAIKANCGLVVKVARPGRTDLRKARVCYECKTGAGELFDCGKETLKGCSAVLYAPVVRLASDENGEYIDLYHTKGYWLTKEAFLEALQEAGAVREKVSSSGVRKVTIQTFWNRSKNAPHGKLLWRMEESLEAHCSASLADWLAMYGE